MTAPYQYELSTLTLSGSQYTIEQTGRDTNLRPEYEARDVTGDTIVQTTSQPCDGTDEFSSIDAEKTEIGHMKSIDT